MCKAIQDMREESREEGRKEGRREGREEGRRESRQESKLEGILEGAITFARELGASVEEVKKSLMAKYGKNEKEAEELLKVYWK